MATAKNKRTAKTYFCIFCCEDATKIKTDQEPLLACTSRGCGKVIRFNEIEKAAIKTFKALGGGTDFPEVVKKPLKVRVPLFLERHVTYLHADKKTWERVPMQLFVRSRNKLHSTLVLRLGNNSYDIIAGIGMSKSFVHSHAIGDRLKLNRKRFWDVNLGYEDRKWPSKPLLKKDDYGYVDELKAWKELKKLNSRRLLKLRPLKPLNKEERKQRVTEKEFIDIIRPFVLRNKKCAVEVYRALCNMKWYRVKDNKAYSCSWRYAGGIVADIRHKNELYTDYYCNGGEGDISKRFENYMNKKGWKKEFWVNQ